MTLIPEKERDRRFPDSAIAKEGSLHVFSLVASSLPHSQGVLAICSHWLAELSLSPIDGLLDCSAYVKIASSIEAANGIGV